MGDAPGAPDQAAAGRSAGGGVPARMLTGQLCAEEETGSGGSMGDAAGAPDQAAAGRSEGGGMQARTLTWQLRAEEETGPGGCMGDTGSAADEAAAGHREEGGVLQRMTGQLQTQAAWQGDSAGAAPAGCSVAGSQEGSLRPLLPQGWAGASTGPCQQEGPPAMASMEQMLPADLLF